MLSDFVLLSFSVYAMLRMIRSAIVDFLFMGRFLDWLVRKNHLLTHELFSCDECMGFWASIILCAVANRWVLILPTWGAVCLITRVTNNALWKHENTQ